MKTVCCNCIASRAETSSILKWPKNFELPGEIMYYPPTKGRLVKLWMELVDPGNSAVHLDTMSFSVLMATVRVI
jgi:hypothetical protein